MNREKTLLNMLSLSCPYDKKPKKSGELCCDSCWAKLPFFVQTRIDDCIRSLSSAYHEAIEFLEKK